MSISSIKRLQGPARIIRSVRVSRPFFYLKTAIGLTIRWLPFGFLLVMLAAMAAPTVGTIDPDLGWHIYLGQKIIQTGQVANHFIGYNSFQTIVRPDHEWISNIIFYYLSQPLQGWPLVILFFLLLVLTTWIIYRTARRMGATSGLIVILLLLLTLPLRIVYGVRVQFLLVLGAALLLYIGKSNLSFKKRIFYYFAFFVIGGNIHGGIVSLAPIPVLLEFDTFWSRNKAQLGQSWGRMLAMVGAVVAGLSINPYGFAYWRLIRDYLADGYYLHHINEWLPAYRPPYRWSEVFLPLGLSLLFLVCGRYWQKIGFGEKIMLLIYLYLGMRHIREFPVLMVVLLPYAAAAASRVLGSGSLQQRSTQQFLAFLPLAVSISLYGYANFNHLAVPFSDSHYPKGSLDYLEQHKEAGNLFNPYEWGGYILWQKPDMKVFVDGRGPEQKVDGDTSLLEEYDIFFSPDDSVIQSKLSKYQITAVITKKYSLSGSKSVSTNSGSKEPSLNDRFKQFLNGGDGKSVDYANLTQYLYRSDEWNLAYEDSQSYVFIKE